MFGTQIWGIIQHCSFQVVTTECFLFLYFNFNNVFFCVNFLFIVVYCWCFAKSLTRVLLSNFFYLSVFCWLSPPNLWEDNMSNGAQQLLLTHINTASDLCWTKIQIEFSKAWRLSSPSWPGPRGKEQRRRPMRPTSACTSCHRLTHILTPWFITNTWSGKNHSPPCDMTQLLLIKEGVDEGQAEGEGAGKGER